MAASGTRRVALLFAQFAAYHIDRCQAVARRLDGWAEVLAVEVATSSATYAWEASGAVTGARKVTLFPGASYDSVSWPRRLWAQLCALWRCDTVMIGIGYNQIDIILLSWLLTLLGVRVVLLSESKFDDKPRKIGKELAKALVLAPYCAAIVGGNRHIDYFRFLGFGRRRVIPGYDTVGLERIRAMGGGVLAPEGTPFARRDFVFVGRFVDKKNLVELVEGFALYAKAAGAGARRLVLIGSGHEEAAIKAAAAALGVAALIDFPGFLGAEEVARRLSGGLALVLPSVEEQWGLVVNEALAFGLPVIVSPAVGSADALVRNLQNGFVIELGAPAGIAAAMLALDQDEALWRRMVAASHQRAWLGDTERLADAVEALCFPGGSQAEDSIARFRASLACPRAKA
jgi:glycosyltransferase involved in cell wall biosynthesis